MTRTKPGEAMTRTIQAREARLKEQLAKIETQKKAARFKVTGRTKAASYVRTWLDALTATELKHEVEIRGGIYGDFESMEQAIDYVHAAMFSGVVCTERPEPDENAVETVPMGANGTTESVEGV